MQLPNTSVTCPWCNTFYPVRPATTNCANCGGPLPKSIGTDRGPKPESPPRLLPKKFVNQVMLWRNTHALIGAIFIIVGIPTILAMGFGLIFAGIGYFLFRYGRKVGKEKIQALEYGITAEGVLTDVRRDTTQSINGRNPFIISYTFTTKEGKQQADSVVSWDDNSSLINHGDEIWVVYIPENPQISSPWPPLV